MSKKIDTSVAVDDSDIALVNEIADHEQITKKQVVHNAISRYYNVWAVS